jgi:RNA polymerase sigma-70 factor (ECF subfamily)
LTTEALLHLRAVFNLARRLTRRDEEARDLTQEAFLRAYAKLHSYAAGTNCKAWLFTIKYSFLVNRDHRGRSKPEVMAPDNRDGTLEDRHEALDLNTDGLIRWP